MAREAQGAVDQDRRGAGRARALEGRGQQGDDLGQHHGHVDRGGAAHLRTRNCRSARGARVHWECAISTLQFVRPVCRGFNPRSERHYLAPGKVCQGVGRSG